MTQSTARKRQIRGIYDLSRQRSTDTYGCGMRAFFLTIAALSILAAGCMNQSEETTTSTVPPSTTTTVAPTPVDDRLVVLTTDARVVVLDSALQELSSMAPPEGSRYRQPIWFDSETVLFSEELADGSGALIAADATTGAIAWRAEMSSSPFYFDQSPDGSATTSLRNNNAEGGLIAELVTRGGDVSPISNRSPFYSAWSPDGSALATHAGQQTLSVIEDGATEVILESTGSYQAPSWTPDGLFTLRSNDQTQTLAIWDDSAFADLARIVGPVQFVASGDRVAIQSTSADEPTGIAASVRAQVVPKIPGGRLVVFDASASSFATVAERFAPFFQWDPTGERLLYAAFAEPPSVDVAWAIWEDGEATEYGPFTPQPEWFGEVVPFFDQYAHSLSYWSASGDAFAYPTVGGAGPIVKVQPTDGSATLTVDDAVWVSWSPPA